ncbi:hypothetical protein PRZ48_006918 [Zasmidium cellare]|uniref:Uncharacterized protein n=1 Tax=Zasmidium cellare TaxID=395010 RepID=A0ABR0EHX7_ZASCE|nr:hypothetical protein PRZ48_006918 [Zasmidium cellare]
MDDIESYIDDRCPTVWGPPSARPRDELHNATSRSRETRQDIPRALPAGSDSRYPKGDRRLKPIDGALLRKLYQATMDEKRRAVEKEAATRRAEVQRSGDVVKPAGEEPALKGFYVPRSSNRSAKGSERVKHQKDEKPVEENANEKKEPDKKAKAEKKGKKKGEKKDHEAQAPTPTDRPASAVLQEDGVAPAQDDRGKAASVVRVEEVETKTLVVEEVSKGQDDADQGKGQQRGQQKQTKKMTKKEKKKQNKGKKELTEAKVQAEEEVLVSGGLPADNNDTGINQYGVSQEDGWIEVGEATYDTWAQKPPTPRPSSKAGTANLQPTVESVTSSRPSKREKISSKPQSPRSAHHGPSPLAEPGFAEVEKPASFVSWEEVGQGVVSDEVVKVASRIASLKSSSKVSSKHVFEGFDQGWDAPEAAAEYVTSERHSSKTERKHGSSRRSKGSAVEDQHAHSSERRSRHSKHSKHSRHSRHSRASRQSQIPGENNDVQGDQLWQEEEPEAQHFHSQERHSGHSKRTKASRHSHRSASKNDPVGDQLWQEQEPEVQHVIAREKHSRHSKHSRASRHSQTPVKSNDVLDGQLWQEEAVNTRSNASTTRTQALSAKFVAREVDPWSQDSLDQVASKHDSSKHDSKPASQLTFEELGEGWVEAPPEVPRSRVSAVSVHSKPFSFHDNKAGSQAWSQRSAEKDGNSQRSEGQFAAGTFEEIGEGWQGPDEFGAVMQSRQTSVHSKEASHKTDSWQSKARNSAEGTFEELGEGWQHPDRFEAVAQSRQTSVHSRKVSHQDWNASEQSRFRQDHPQLGRESGKASQTWEEVEEQRSGVRSTRATTRTSQSSDHDAYPEDNRPTVFAGKGWISPHPLSRSPTEMASPPQSKIVLPSQAYPHGATMTYEQWKAVQEEGLRRNISPTESHLTINARRAQSRHRFAGWGAYSSDGHRFEEVIPEDEAEDSVSGPASYRVPSMDSERSSGGLLSDERPPTQGATYVHDLGHESTWDDRRPSELNERSSRHSRVQTLSEWSHKHSGSKQAYDGSGLSGGSGSHNSRHSSSKHDSSHSHNHSSRQSSRQSGSQKSSGHGSSHHDDDGPGSTRSKTHTIGWGRLSLGTARSRQSRHQENGGHVSHRSSRHSKSAASKAQSDVWKASPHEWIESAHSHGHGRHRKSHSSRENSFSARDLATSAHWTESPHSLTHSRHHSRHTSHAHHAPSHHPSAASLSSSERMQEVMEEGRNIWSDIPQYDGTTSHREQFIARSDVSAVPTSQLYWKRYQGHGAESGAEQWE